jgi:hypothetical protein
VEALPTNSHNHFMLGHLMEWFYNGLGGIDQADSSIAFKHIVIDPRPSGNVDWVHASYDSPFGMISVDWQKKDDFFSVILRIPANTIATVYLPAKDSQTVRESTFRSTIGGWRIVGHENGKIKLKVGSGEYGFVISTPNNN